MIFLSAFADEAGSTIEEQISALNKNHVSYLELRSIGGKNVADFTYEEAESYYKKLTENKIKVWSIGSPIGKEKIDCDFEEYLKKVEHVLKIAKIFKADKIRMFSFFEAYDKPKLCKDYLKQMVKLADEYGVKLCHENEKEVYGDTLERVLELYNADLGLKFIYDPANFLQCGEKADDTLNALENKIEYFHIKDVIVETGELVPAGYGDGKIDDIVERVSSDIVFTLEPHLSVFDAYKTIDNTEMKHKFKFNSNAESFDFACDSLKKILKDKGYAETQVDGVYAWEKGE
jgi:sugar phosphate isomerase/epimerase